MNIDVSWDAQTPSTLRITLHDNWTWEDLYAANKDVIAMMHGTEQIAHLLLDFTQADTIPAGGVIMHMRNLLGTYPANCGLRIIVTGNVLVERLMGIFQAAFQTGLGKQVYTAATLDDAYQLIHKHLRLQVEV